jgi:hypothetical protein
MEFFFAITVASTLFGALVAFGFFVAKVRTNKGLFHQEKAEGDCHVGT